MSKNLVGIGHGQIVLGEMTELLYFLYERLYWRMIVIFKLNFYEIYYSFKMFIVSYLRLHLLLAYDL